MVWVKVPSTIGDQLLISRASIRLTAVHIARNISHIQLSSTGNKAVNHQIIFSREPTQAALAEKVFHSRHLPNYLQYRTALLFLCAA